MQEPIDKSTWGPGPWQKEPDYLEWTDEETLFHCEIKRTHMGHLCGYVHVPKGNPNYGRTDADLHMDCHGGVTYGEINEETGLWVIGFDCAHFSDMSPGNLAAGGTYQDIQYVRKEVTALAQQLFSPLEALASSHSWLVNDTNNSTD